jgi:DNA-binding transcriptional regulator YhcF (GntR family)
MKLWIAKSSEIPVREQIVTQVRLAIASGELGIGDRLPSTSEIARRFKIHANTVSHAYRELAESGWIEFRTGSGFYVHESDAELENSLERLVAAFLKDARKKGFSAADIERCVARFVGRKEPNGVVLLEDDDAFREILVTEIRESIPVNVVGAATSEFDFDGFSDDAVIASMFDEKPKIAASVECVFLKARSVAGAMTDENRPAADDLIAVVSDWEYFLLLARTMLIAARVDSESLIIRSTREADWRKGIDVASLVICDARTAKHFASDTRLRTFRLISDDSLDELRETLGI